MPLTFQPVRRGRRAPWKEGVYVHCSSRSSITSNISAIYIAITIGQALPLAYVVSHVLKVLGGMAGGLVVDRRVNREGHAPVVGALT